MKPWTTLFAAALFAVIPATGHAADTRFTQSLTASECTEVGLNKLSSDQVAVIDALVRRDLANPTTSSQKDPAVALRFSQRLTADERRIAGLALLTEAEVARLDALVDRHGSASRSTQLLGPLVFATSSPRLRSPDTKAATAPEVHGSISLSIGGGKGFSERTGSMNLNYVDPEHGFSIAVGYSETHMKGSDGYYIYRDPTMLAPPLLP